MHAIVRLEGILSKVRSRIDRVGWAMVHVSDGFRHSAWTYTIGLSARLHHPELIVMGLDPDHAEHALDYLAHDIEQGDPAQPGDRRVVDGLEMTIGPVHQSHWRSELFAIWHLYYRFARTRPRIKDALQVLWPDNDGRFPGEPGFEPGLAHLQTMLGSGSPVVEPERAV